MRKLFLIGMILLTMVGLGIAQTQQTTVNTFVPEEDCPLVIFALNGWTEVDYWDQKTIQITYTINVPIETTKQLEAVVNTKDYTIEMNFYEEERVLIFDQPKLEALILKNPQLQEEIISIKIFVPNHTQYRIITIQPNPVL